MKKTNLILIAMAVTAGIAALSSCQNQPAAEAAEGANKDGAAQKGAIVYFNLDRVINEYDMANDLSSVLQTKLESVDQELNRRGNKLQNDVNSFQEKIDKGLLTRSTAEAQSEKLQKQQADLEGLQQRLGTEFQSETEKFNKALRDSIQHFLAVYNKDKQYSLILTKQGDNILYGDKALDITTQVVAGLNKAYKKTDLTKAASKDEKKK